MNLCAFCSWSLILLPFLNWNSSIWPRMLYLWSLKLSSMLVGAVHTLYTISRTIFFMPTWHSATGKNSSYRNQSCFVPDRVTAILTCCRIWQQVTFYFPYLPLWVMPRHPLLLANIIKTLAQCHAFMCELWGPINWFQGSWFKHKIALQKAQVVVLLRHSWVMKERALTSSMVLFINEFILSELLGDRLEESLWRVSLSHVFLLYFLVVVNWVTLFTMFFHHDTSISPQPKFIESTNQPGI